MSIICPLLSNKKVADEFNEIKDATSKKTAYHIWSQNNGHGIDKAPNGEPSILFHDLLEALNDRVLAIRAKASLYTKRFMDVFGNWLKGEHPKFTKLDKNGEPKYIYAKHVFSSSASAFIDKLIPKMRSYRPKAGLKINALYDSEKTLFENIQQFYYDLLGVDIFVDDEDHSNIQKIKDTVEFFINNKLEDQIENRLDFLNQEKDNTPIRYVDQYIQNMYQFLKKRDLSVLDEYDEQTVEIIHDIFPKLFDGSQFKSVDQAFGYYEHAILSKNSVYDNVYKKLNATNIKRLYIDNQIKKLNAIKEFIYYTPNGKNRIKNRIFNEIDRIDEYINYKNEEDNSKAYKLRQNLFNLWENVINEDSETFNIISSNFKLGQKYKVTDLLKKLPRTGEYRGLVDKLLNFFTQKGDIDVLIINDEKYSGTGGFYVPYDHTIVLNAGSGLFIADPIRVLLHESFHAITARYLLEHEDFQKVVNEYIKYLDVYEPRWLRTSPRGMLNALEFVAEFFADPNFRELLKNLPAMSDEYSDSFSHVYEFIKNSSGESAFDQIESIVNFIIDSFYNETAFLESIGTLSAYGYTEEGYQAEGQTTIMQKNHDTFVQYSNTFESNRDEYISKKLKEESEKNEDVDKEATIINADEEFVENENRKLIGDTQQKLIDAFGLVQKQDADGNIYFESQYETEGIPDLVIQLLEYISDDAKGYYDYNSKIDAAHHVIAIGIDKADPSTFNHELAHHYIRMFWKSKLIQTALRAVDKPGMSDEEREEALVDFITSVTTDSLFQSRLESDSILQRFWSSLAYGLYKAFDIKSDIVINGLMQNVARSFMLNKERTDIENKKRLYVMSQMRMYQTNKSGFIQKVKAKFGKHTYQNMLAEARRKRENKDVEYTAVQQDPMQEAVRTLIQGTISRNKTYRQNSVTNPRILVQMSIDEADVRHFAEKIAEYRKQVIDTRGWNRDNLTNSQEVEMSHSLKERKENIKLIRDFIYTARMQLMDLYEKLQSLETTRYSQYFVRNVVNEKTGEEESEYLTLDEYNALTQDEKDEVDIVNIDFKELQEIKQNTIGFYQNTISQLQEALSSFDAVNYYNKDDIDELYEELSGDNRRGVYVGEMGLIQLLESIDTIYNHAAQTRLKSFIHTYLRENTGTLDEELRNRMEYSIYTWLEDQCVFGDVGSYEVWLGMASNSSSPLIRMLQNIIDENYNEQNNTVNEKGDYLWDLREAARKAVKHHCGNFDKLFMEKDEFGFTGNFAQYVNIGKFQNKRNKFIDKILFSKGGILSKVRQKIGDPYFTFEIDEDGFINFPEGCEQEEKEFLHALNDWYGENCVRRFTVEYERARINMLSSKTRRAQRAIDLKINAITSACKIDGKPHTELLSVTKRNQLKNLYRKKAQLSNPFDEFGNLKEKGTDEYQIAKELTEWRLFQQDKLKYTTDYDTFNEAKSNAADEEEFERFNTYRTINPKIWDKVQQIFAGAMQSKELEELRVMRRQLISIVRERGYTTPNIKQLWDDETGQIKPEYAAFWLNLKEIDEKLISLKQKMTQKQRNQYEKLLGKLSVYYNDPSGRRIRWYTHIEQQIKKKLKEQYPNDPNLQSKIDAELKKFRAIGKERSGKEVNKELSIFSITGPIAKKIKIDGEEIETLVNEPIQIYSKIDVENSDKKYVDERFDETSPYANQPFTQRTKGGLKPGQQDYTNHDYIKNIESSEVPKEIRDYYEALINTTKEAYESIPFAGKYDMRLPQRGCSSRQVYFRNKNVFKAPWYNLKRTWGPINESDIDINSDYELRPDGTRSMNIPVRYIKRVPDGRYINSDVFGSVMKFYEMSVNYKNKSQLLPIFNQFLDKLKGNNTNRNQQRKLLQGVINRQFFDRNSNLDFDDENPSVYNLKYKYMLKFVPVLKALSQTGLLALGWIPGIISYLDPALQLIADSIQGKYIDVSDYTFGHLFVAWNMPSMLINLFTRRPFGHQYGGYLNKGMSYFGLYNTGASAYEDRNMSGLTRLTKSWSRLAMSPFSMGEYMIKAESWATVMHSYKYYNGKYYNRRQFIKEMTSSGKMTAHEAKRYFNSPKIQFHTLLNAYHIDKKTGKFQPKDNEYGRAVTKELEDAITKRVKNRATNYNYIVPETERSKIQTNVLASFLVVMRTFMLVGYAERLKMQRDFQQKNNTTFAENKQRQEASRIMRESRYLSGGYNFQTDEIDNGTFQGIFTAIRHPISAIQYIMLNMKNKGWSKSRWNPEYNNIRKQVNLSESDIYGMNRTLTELLIVAILATAQIVFHNKMVDDDRGNDYASQVIDMILMRLTIERMTFGNPDTFFDLINSVTPSKSDFDKKIKLFDAINDTQVGFSEHGTNFNEWDQVKQGGFRNTPKAFKEWAQTFSSLGFYNFYSKSNVEGVKSAKKFYDKMYYFKRYWHDPSSSQKSNGNSKSGYKDEFSNGFSNDFSNDFSIGF